MVEFVSAYVGGLVSQKNLLFCYSSPHVCRAILAQHIIGEFFVTKTISPNVTTPYGTEKDWLTIRQVSELLPGHPHVGTVTRWTQKPIRGQILPSTLCGGKRLIRISDLQRFMETFNPVERSPLPTVNSKRSAVAKATADVLLSNPSRAK